MLIGGIVAYLLLALVMLLVPAFVGAYLARNKGRSGLVGALLGFFLGWVGVVIVLLLSDARAPGAQGGRGRAWMYRECPHCKESMRMDAGVCPHCRLESPTQALPVNKAERLRPDRAKVRPLAHWGLGASSVLFIVLFMLPALSGWGYGVRDVRLDGAYGSAIWGMDYLRPLEFHHWSLVTTVAALITIAMFAAIAASRDGRSRAVLASIAVVTSAFVAIMTVYLMVCYRDWATIWLWLALPLAIAVVVLSLVAAALETRSIGAESHTTVEPVEA